MSSTVAPDRQAAADPGVIAAWNAIGERAIFAEGLTPIPSSGLYFGFVQLAVYNAVVTIEGRYEPYTRQPRPRRAASTQAAAVAAASSRMVYGSSVRRAASTTRTVTQSASGHPVPMNPT
jgi:hypothetical protein